MMELHERLSTARPVATTHGPRPVRRAQEPVHLAVIGELGPQLFNVDHGPGSRCASAWSPTSDATSPARPGISRDDRERLAAEIADDILGHGPLERLLADDSVTEIMVNGPFDVWVERQGRLYETTRALQRRLAPAPDHQQDGRAGRSADRRVVADGRRAPAGRQPRERHHSAALAERARSSRSASSRRSGSTFEDMVRLGTLTTETVDFLQRCVGAELNILISGGTGTGKTTLLNALSPAIPDAERIVTIEDAAELQLKQEHVLRLEARPKNIEGEGEIAIRDLVRNSLRMRPDRIIVGEVRGAEALDMLQAMNTGHDGSLSHRPRQRAARRARAIETMVLMAGYDLPVRAIRQQVAVGARPDRAPRAPRGRLAPGHRDHRGAADGVGRDHAAGALRVQDRGRSLRDRTVVGSLDADRPATDVPAQVREARHRRCRTTCSVTPGGSCRARGEGGR